jgi:hypothetical protein
LILFYLYVSTRERSKGGRCHVTYFPFCSHVGVHCQQNRRIICQYGGVDGRKISKMGFPWKKIISLRNLVSDLRPIDMLTGEIAVEVTGVVGVSPALWYFRYIASIFLTTQAPVVYLTRSVSGAEKEKSDATCQHIY